MSLPVSGERLSGGVSHLQTSHTIVAHVDTGRADFAEQRSVLAETFIEGSKVLHIAITHLSSGGGESRLLFFLCKVRAPTQRSLNAGVHFVFPVSSLTLQTAVEHLFGLRQLPT
jgi:hypothetical protein